jgi:hypothetical protein
MLIITYVIHVGGQGGIGKYDLGDTGGKGSEGSQKMKMTILAEGGVNKLNNMEIL